MKHGQKGLKQRWIRLYFSQICRIRDIIIFHHQKNGFDTSQFYTQDFFQDLVDLLYSQSSKRLSNFMDE